MAVEAPASRPHVPARQVVLSAVALWLTYFVLITVRGLVVELGEFNDLLWRRALVTLAGIAVTLLAWPILRRFDGRSLGTRVAAALVIMLPAALALAVVNQQAFAPVEARMMAQELQKAAQGQPAGQAVTVTVPNVKIRHDLSGNVLVDVGEPPAPPAPPAPPPPPEPTPLAPGVKVSPEPPRPPDFPVAVHTAADGSAVLTAPGGVEIRRAADGATQVRAPDSDVAAAPGKAYADEGLWRQLTDVALGRYFLLIAWAALYLALGNGEMARAAERREGEYRRAAKAAELRSLRYQVNPHFLFNTLNSLSALVMVGRTEQAERMIQTIANFYRQSLTADPTADVPLAEEIALQRAYLDIEAVRFPDRLRVEFQIPRELERACVPGMILQPLVENSIKYAVSATTRPVTIRIAARAADGLLVLTVADDGPCGVAAPGGTGIGLANVKSRLEARFGAQGTVEGGPLPAGGYATVLTLPVLWKDC